MLTNSALIHSALIHSTQDSGFSNEFAVAYRFKPIPPISLWAVIRLTLPLLAKAVLSRAMSSTGGSGAVRFEPMAVASLLTAAIITTAGWLRAKRLLAETVRDREDLANSSLVIEEERRMLELVAKGAPLNEVLNTLTLAIERLSPGALCTVMLLDEEHRRFLSVASGPSLPQEYLQALRDLEIGPEVGACGSAAARNETVVVEDVATDPKFALARELLMSHGMRSCWSQPIRDSRNRVLGTFAVYHRYVAKPRPAELRMACAAAQLAGNAIERIRAEKALRETTKRLNLAEKVARFGIWEADFLKDAITISKGMAAMMERSSDKLRLTWAEFSAAIHPEDLASVEAAGDPAKARAETVQHEFRLLLPSGAVRWVRSQWRFETGKAGTTGATGAMIDITEERKMLAQSQEARAAAEAAAHAARQAESLEQDRKTILELVAKDQPLDRIITEMASAVASHLPGSLCSIRIDLTDATHISVNSRLPDGLAVALDRIPIASIHRTLSSEAVRNLSACPEWVRFIENCEDFPFQHYRAVPILRNTRLTGVIISFFAADRANYPAEEQLLESWGQFASLAVERRGLYEQLSYRAQHDSLTGLLNRASLYDRVDAQIRRSGPERATMALLYLDLDLFKEINDRYGHGIGDKVLQGVSRQILETVRHTDSAARIGGDEFVVILPGVSDRKEASRIAAQVVSAIEQPVSFSGRELRVEASLGIGIYPDDGADTDGLLKAADEDMYRAKLRRRSFRALRHAPAEEQSEAECATTLRTA
jgi:diguanylate cyclase (GGDEF)-like protein